MCVSIIQYESEFIYIPCSKSIGQSCFPHEKLFDNR